MELDSPERPDKRVATARGNAIARLVEASPLPRYAYIPGRNDRPPDAPALSPASPWPWQACRAYLRGIDLFNHGYYWEAHESWEAVWLAAGRQGRTANFLKGLIKLTAALVAARQGKPIGVARHARRAGELFSALMAEADSAAVVMGLSLQELAQEAARVSCTPDEFVDTRDLPVIRVTNFTLRVVANRS